MKDKAKKRFLELESMATNLGWKNMTDDDFDLMFTFSYISGAYCDLVDEHGIDKIVDLLCEGMNQKNEPVKSD